ncbi:MAG: type VI secretion system-associated FHA domain protein TagH [Methyloprofundus sp.]|nr:type VI secretion system-associated FHA domain protein TagH [Methyloprofundus sp.]
MKLILRVISQAGDELESITLQQEPATIGRNVGNTLVLDDPKRYISGHHAFIDYRESSYFVTDASTNGVLVNDAADAIGNGNSVKLNDGDRLHIGQYTIVVSLGEASPDILSDSVASNDEPLANDPFADISIEPVGGNNSDFPTADQGEGAFDIPGLASDDAAKQADINTVPADDIFADDWFTKNNSESSSAKELFTDNFFAEPQHSEESVVESKPSKSEPIPSAEVIIQSQPAELTEDPFPDHFFSTEEPSEEVNETQLDKPEKIELDKQVEHRIEVPVPAEPELAGTEAITKLNGISSPDVEVKSPEKPEPKQPVGSADTQALMIDNFLRGAGLENAGISDQLTPEKFFIIGNILRASVQGTMDVLGGRAKIKNEMHLDVTMIRAVQNNPVKFSVGAEEAIRKMLVPQDKGYLPAEEAIEEVFDDIRAHQFSVIAGMQTALLEVLKRFDPEKLEHRLQKQSPIAASIPIHKQAKLWRLFATLYDDIESEATDNFYHLFGQAFAESYEEQIIKLKNSKRNTPL